MIRYEVKHKCEEDTFDPLDKPYHLSKLTEHCNNCGEKIPSDILFLRDAMRLEEEK